MYHFALLSQSVFPVPAGPARRSKDEPTACCCHPLLRIEKRLIVNSSATSLGDALIRVLISIWVIHQIFKQERKLETTVRIVRWVIVLAGVATFVLGLVYLHLPMIVLIGFVSFPTGLVFLFPELTVYIVRGYRLALRRVRGNAAKKRGIENG